MQNKPLTLAIIVAVAIVFGVLLAVKQANDPIMRRIVEQQSEILALQRKIDRQLSGGAESVGGAQGGDVGARLTLIDKKLDMLAGALRPQQPAGPQFPPDEFTKIHKIDIGQSYFKGKADAPVTITEFTDLQCPYCARFHPTLNEVLQVYPDKVKVVLKNYPLQFHQQARPAAKAAFAAGEQGKYWEMIEKLLENQRELSDDKFKAIAGEIGLDVDKFLKDYKERDAEWEKRITADFELGNEVAVRGTPTYYINGRKTMARDLATYKKEIDEALNQK